MLPIGKDIQLRFIGFPVAKSTTTAGPGPVFRPDSAVMSVDFHRLHRSIEHTRQTQVLASTIADAAERRIQDLDVLQANALLEPSQFISRLQATQAVMQRVDAAMGRSAHDDHANTSSASLHQRILRRVTAFQEATKGLYPQGNNISHDAAMTSTLLILPRPLPTLPAYPTPLQAQELDTYTKALSDFKQISLGLLGHL
jgi:uncharacterized membrane protein YccC